MENSIKMAESNLARAAATSGNGAKFPLDENTLLAAGLFISALTLMVDRIMERNYNLDIEKGDLKIHLGRPEDKVESESKG